MLRILLAATHLIALGIGLGAVLARGTALRRNIDEATLRYTIRNDMLWGIAAILWIGTGLWRYMGSIEKDMSYYNANHLFLTKMACLVLIIALEIKPMRILARWRKARRGGAPAADVVSAADARYIFRVSHIQGTLVVIMVVLATAMARGVGGR